MASLGRGIHQDVRSEGMAQALCRARIPLPEPPNPGALADKIFKKCVRVTETGSETAMARMPRMLFKWQGFSGKAKMHVKIMEKVAPNKLSWFRGRFE